MIALSTTEAEYISFAHYYLQLLWIRNQLEDYNHFEGKIPIYCDHNVAISLSKNPTLHSRAKHIEVKHHFIHDHVNKGIVDLQYVNIKDQLADIFTKPLVEDRINHLLTIIGMRSVK